MKLPKLSKLTSLISKMDDDEIKIVFKDRRSSLTWQLTKGFAIAAAAVSGYVHMTSDNKEVEIAPKNTTHIDILNCNPASEKITAKTKNKADSKKAKIAVLEIKGGIGANHHVKNFRAILQKIITEGDFSEIALKITSPGGPAYNTFDIFGLLQQAETCGLELNSFVDAYAFSGGYVAALAGEKIYARHPYSELGSVGVIMRYTAYSGLLKKIGVEERVHKTGPVKGGISPKSPETPEQIAELRKGLKKLQAVFWNIVAKERGDRLTISQDNLLAGGTFFADDALKHGMIDGISSIDKVMKEKYPNGFTYVVYDPMKDTLPSSFLDGWVSTLVGSNTATTLKDRLATSGQTQLLHHRP